MTENIIAIELLDQREIDILKSIELVHIPLYNGHGYVELVDMMPRMVPEGRTADVAITRNARISYLQGDKSAKEDETLVRYLVENRHTSPLESVVFQFRMKIPIFVERQLIRHRTARVNEQSLRYTKADDSSYYPTMRMQSQVNRQGSSDQEITPAIESGYRRIQELNAEVYRIYETIVETKDANDKPKPSAAREVARVALPVAQMIEMTWQMDLHNLQHFLRLRIDAHAQLEIQEFANAVYRLVQPRAPIAMKAFQDFQLNSVTFNQDEQRYMRNELVLTGRRKTVADEKIAKLGLFYPTVGSLTGSLAPTVSSGTLVTNENIAKFGLLNPTIGYVTGTNVSSGITSTGNILTEIRPISSNTTTGSY